MAEILVILLIIAAVVVLIALVKALKNTDAPAMPKPTSITTTAKPAGATPASSTPKLISTVGPKHSPQVTVYTNSAHPNAFRCPVCDSKPAPSARQCQVCGQSFQMKGVN